MTFGTSNPLTNLLKPYGCGTLCYVNNFYYVTQTNTTILLNGYCITIYFILCNV